MGQAAHYPAYLRAGFRALRKDAANTIRRGGRLEGKNGFPYALFRSIAGPKSPALVIAAFNIRG